MQPPPHRASGASTRKNETCDSFKSSGLLTASDLISMAGEIESLEAMTAAKGEG
jgi:hypothetical protein